jgi:hypothetical protein
MPDNIHLSYIKAHNEDLFLWKAGDRRPFSQNRSPSIQPLVPRLPASAVKLALDFKYVNLPRPCKSIADKLPAPVTSLAGRVECT